MTNPQCEQYSVVLSQLLEKQRQEEDQLLHVFNQHLREALQESRMRSAYALFASVESITLAIKQKDDELALANLNTQERLANLQNAIEVRDAWQSIAAEKMEMVADLQATLETMTTPAPCLSSTLPPSEEYEVGESSHARPPFYPCKHCNYLRACTVFLPCRHLAVCQLCDFTVSACPVCKVNKMESIEIVFENE